jgi:hypothetical protein
MKRGGNAKYPKKGRRAKVDPIHELKDIRG